MRYWALIATIIFIFGDDWGYGDLGSYGHKVLKTPHLDQLAKEGTRFEEFHVTSGVCSPSRCSVITGQFPARWRVWGHFASNKANKARSMPNWLNPNCPSLPRQLQKVGYKTAHFGKWHLGGGGLPHGDPKAPKPKEYGYDETRVWNGNGPTWKGDQRFPTVRYMDSDRVWVPASSRIAVDETIRFIDKHRNEKFYVNLWLKDPHAPLWPTEEQQEPYKHLAGNQLIYYSVLHDADKHIGRLLKAVDELGLRQNTIVIFSSDNGPSKKYVGSTAGLRGRKATLFEGGVRLPFIIRWPDKVPAGKVDKTSVLSTVDFMPTFCKLAKARLPKSYNADGEDIGVIFSGKPFQRSKPLFWEYGKKSVIRVGDWKLYCEKKKPLELWDIKNDPQEKVNKIRQQPKKAEDLHAQLLKWFKELPNK